MDENLDKLLKIERVSQKICDYLNKFLNANINKFSHSGTWSSYSPITIETNISKSKYGFNCKDSICDKDIEKDIGINIVLKDVRSPTQIEQEIFSMPLNIDYFVIYVENISDYLRDKLKYVPKQNKLNKLHKLEKDLNDIEIFFNEYFGTKIDE